MTPYESMFCSLVNHELRSLDPFVEIEWDYPSETYALRLNHSERFITVSEDRFRESIANGRLHESIVESLRVEIGNRLAFQGS
jgi:hypothetical protein